MGPKCAGRQPICFEYKIGNQLILTGGIGASGNRGLAHGGVQGQRRLDFRGLDAVAANLDLIVDPAQELQRPVGAPRARSPVRNNRTSGFLLKGCGTKRSRSAPAVQITIRETWPAGEQLAGNPYRYWLTAAHPRM